MTLMAYDGLVPAEQVINGRAEELVQYRPKQPNSTEPRLEAINLADFVAEPLPQRQYVMAPILPERGLAMLFASRGVGKTQVAVNIGWAAACGQPFLRWYAPKPRPVLYVDGEMPLWGNARKDGWLTWSPAPPRSDRLTSSAPSKACKVLA